MKKPFVLSIVFFSAIATVGLATGVTFAAGYQAPLENNSIQFGAVSSEDLPFQDLSYYFGGGNGADDEHPYLISNSQHLRNFAKLQNIGQFPTKKYFALSTSFQFEGDSMEPIGNAANPFIGEFTGAGHTISFLSVVTAETNAGMFGVVGTNTNQGIVQELTLVAPSVHYNGDSACNIGLVAGTRNTTSGSKVEKIEIYGGKARWANTIDLRAKLIIDAAPNSGSNSIVGQNGSSDSSTTGFIDDLANAGKYNSNKVYTSISVSGEYKLFLYEGSVVNGGDPS